MKENDCREPWVEEVDKCSDHYIEHCNLRLELLLSIFLLHFTGSFTNETKRSTICFYYKVTFSLSIPHIYFPMSCPRDRYTLRHASAAGSSRARGVSTFDDYHSQERYYSSYNDQEDHSRRHPSVGASGSRGPTPPFVMDDAPSSRPSSFKSGSSGSSSVSEQYQGSKFFRGKGKGNRTSSGSSNSSSQPSYHSVHAVSDDGFQFESPGEQYSSSHHTSYSSSHAGWAGSPAPASVSPSGFSDQLTPGGYHYREGSDVHSKYHAYKKSSALAAKYNTT